MRWRSHSWLHPPKPQVFSVSQGHSQWNGWHPLPCSRPHSSIQSWCPLWPQWSAHHQRSCGMLKRCFKILVIPPEYTLDVQVRVFPACAALHNVILKYDPKELQDMLPPDGNDDIIKTGHSIGELATEFPQWVEKEWANSRRDAIARDMWEGYQDVLWAQGM